MINNEKWLQLIRKGWVKIKAVVTYRGWGRYQ
jgi:hypothetical protein